MAEVYIGNKPATVYFYIARAWSDGRAGMPMFGLTGPVLNCLRAKQCTSATAR